MKYVVTMSTTYAYSGSHRPVSTKKLTIEAASPLDAAKQMFTATGHSPMPPDHRFAPFPQRKLGVYYFQPFWKNLKSYTDGIVSVQCEAQIWVREDN